MGCLRGWRVALRGAPRQHANRVYYGMFYAVLALLIYEPYASSKHSGVLAYFNKHFVKSGLFSESLGILSMRLSSSGNGVIIGNILS